jgi:hypothetical protein
MGLTMDERVRKIFERAYETIDRVNDMEMVESGDDDEHEREISEYIESCLEPDWEPPTPRLRKKTDTVAVRQTLGTDWDDWLGARLNKFAEEYSEMMVRVTFTRMDRFKKASDAQIAQLEATVRDLRAEVFALREMMIKNGGSNIVRSDSPPRRTIDIN